MPANIDEYIEEYFNNEENLHKLRNKLFNLDSYRLQSDINEELVNIYEEKEQVAEDLKKKHKKALEELEEKHQKEIRKISNNYKNKIMAKEEELSTYKTFVADELKNAKNDRAKLEYWQGAFMELDEAYKNFSSLSSKHREDIAGIFGGCDTPFDFLCGSVQKSHLEQLWDYIADEVESVDTDKEEANRLTILFDFSFNSVNRSQKEPLYKRLTAQYGSAFDGDIMGRAKDSPQLGKVRELIFAGFAYEVTGSVVRRSLVILE